jgi:hypothetical protein
MITGSPSILRFNEKLARFQLRDSGHEQERDTINDEILMI